MSDNLVRSNPRFLPYIPDLRRAINQLQFLCQGDPGYTSPEPTTGAKESTFHVFNPSTLEDESFAPDDLSSWDWATLEGRDSDVNPGDAIQFNRLCLLSDTLSNIDSDLSRSPSDFLKVRFIVLSLLVSHTSCLTRGIDVCIGRNLSVR